MQAGSSGSRSPGLPRSWVLRPRCTGLARDPPRPLSQPTRSRDRSTQLSRWLTGAGNGRSTTATSAMHVLVVHVEAFDVTQARRSPRRSSSRAARGSTTSWSTCTASAAAATWPRGASSGRRAAATSKSLSDVAALRLRRACARAAARLGRPPRARTRRAAARRSCRRLASAAAAASSSIEVAGLRTVLVDLVGVLDPIGLDVGPVEHRLSDAPARRPRSD